MGLSISSMICRKAQDPFALVDYVERLEKENLLGQEGVERAVAIYGQMVEYCQAHEIPLRYIRVTVFGASRTKSSDGWISELASLQTTCLRFNGEDWTVKREEAPLFNYEKEWGGLTFPSLDEAKEFGATPGLILAGTKKRPLRIEIKISKSDED